MPEETNKPSEPKKPSAFAGKLLQITGELLITAGLVLGLFAFWQVAISDEIEGAKLTETAEQYAPAPSASPTASATTAKNTLVDVKKAKKEGSVFAKMYIPGLKPRWESLVGQGTRWKVINNLGIGHYMNTEWPGEVGNFAVAGHRGGFGGPLRNVHLLKAGDKVWVETNDGWYVYKYLDTKIVLPSDVGVIKSVPDFLPGAKKGGKYLTLTSCEPIFVNTHRIIVWFELQAAFPLDFGMPLELQELRAKKK